MKLTNEKIVKIILYGFLGLIVSFIIGAATVVLSPFSLLYAVGYLIVLVCLLVKYIKNKPDEAKASIKGLIDYASDPKVIDSMSAKRKRKAAAKRRKKQITRSKRRARSLVIAYSAGKALRSIIE